MHPTSKTQFFETIEELAANGCKLDGFTKSNLIRKLDTTPRPTILIDEIDKNYGDKDTKSASVGVLNSGYRSKGKYEMSVSDGQGGWQPQAFPTFAPKAFSGLRNLPSDLASRCITITMQKAPRGSLEDWHAEDFEALAHVLRDRMADTATDELRTAVAKNRPTESKLQNREKDIARPLIVIGDLVGTAGERDCVPPASRRCRGLTARLTGVSSCLRAS